MSRRILDARVERIERAIVPQALGDVSLSIHERVELAALEHERAARFPSSIDDWDMAMCQNFLAYQAEMRGPAQRLAELRHRALPSEERARLAAFEICLDAMSQVELDDYLLERSYPS